MNNKTFLEIALSGWTLSLVAEKGGTGKSTLAISLVGVLAHEQNKRVLVIDTDAQASASKFFLGAAAVQQLPLAETVATMFGAEQISKSQLPVHETQCEGIWITPASIHLRHYNEPDPQVSGDMQNGISKLVEQVRERFDAILIDTPPSIACLPAWSALLASDFVISPVRPDSFSLEAIAGVQQALLDAKQGGNRRLSFLGFLVNMRDSRKSLHRICEETLRDLWQQNVFATTIPDLVAFSESISLKKPVTSSARRSPAAQKIRELIVEIEERMQFSQHKGA